MKRGRSEEGGRNTKPRQAPAVWEELEGEYDAPRARNEWSAIELKAIGVLQHDPTLPAVPPLSEWPAGREPVEREVWPPRMRVAVVGALSALQQTKTHLDVWLATDTRNARAHGEDAAPAPADRTLEFIREQLLTVDAWQTRLIALAHGEEGLAAAAFGETGAALLDEVQDRWERVCVREKTERVADIVGAARQVRNVLDSDSLRELDEEMFTAMRRLTEKMTNASIYDDDAPAESGDGDRDGEEDDGSETPLTLEEMARLRAFRRAQATEELSDTPPDDGCMQQ